MFGYIFRRFFGTHNDRLLRQFAPIVKQISDLEPELEALDDDTLKAKTDEFKQRIADGEKLDKILPEAFAVMREASKRVLNMRHYDVQMIGGLTLHNGMIAEMVTGEGKTLVATLPAYLNGLTGKGVHVVTVNDYLAGRDRNWMGPVYEFLGLSVGAIQNDTPPSRRQQEYASDITYGTNNEFGFDYLRDNMVMHASQRSQRELNFCIVDEVDSILIDEARTPLIISGPSDDATDLYERLDVLIPKLSEEDYSIEEKTKSIHLTDEGVKKIEEFLSLENLYAPNNVELVHHVSQALRAHKMFKKDVDYVVQENQVIIVDEFTGRLLAGRRFSDGLHQALEAKERVKIEQENQTLASVTFQNFFRMYDKLSGMTGTAVTEAAEFFQIYKLQVICVPTNKPLSRTNIPDAIYRTHKEKFEAVIVDIIENHKTGRPVLVGTVSIEHSEELSRMLQKANIPHNVLNAKFHEQEAEIIGRAGQGGSVTIATNMAGRGTDIVLGEGVAAKGGLHVIGTERHESRRIDNQLRGRTGRQGDPGSSQFFLSLDDDLMRIFGSDRISGIMEKLGMDEGQSIQHPLVTRSIETAQARVEGRNFDIRKELIKYDDIMNRQRTSIYDERKSTLEGDNLKSYYSDCCEDMVEDAAQGLDKAAQVADDDKSEDLRKEVAEYLTSIFPVEHEQALLADPHEFRDVFFARVKKIYDEKESVFGAEVLRRIERMILLDVIDSKWKDHLRDMDELREGIGLRAYGQKDPVVEYQHEGFAMFEEMTRRIKEDAVSFLLRAQAPKSDNTFLNTPPPPPIHQNLKFVHAEAGSAIPKAAQPQAQQTLPPHMGTEPQLNTPNQPKEKKVGRNDPCPCDSGKKYKKCHGA
ncbi:MAG: preprotein translocase subunit SecA [Candidatus Omnitrophota bacterium]|jgi:preprotein translocase subunit SecA